MERLTYQQFLDVRDEFDVAVKATPGISHFCSSSSWAVPAFKGLHEYDRYNTNTLIVREDDSWAVFVEKTANYFYSFESAWMFQCPLIGPNAVDLFFRAKDRYFPGLLKGFVIGGVPKDGPVFHDIMESRPLRHHDSFPATDCMILDLTDGVDAWLARRSKKFRRSIRVSQRKCTEAGVVIHDIEPDFNRLMGVQRRTTKWLDGSDILHHDDCKKFYTAMLAEKGLRLRVATINGEDVAFLLGAVFGKTFRGLQMSYAEEYRHLGLGNFLQIDTMRQVAMHDSVVTYDFGMFSEYKSRWADEMREFVGCFVVF